MSNQRTGGRRVRRLVVSSTAAAVAVTGLTGLAATAPVSAAPGAVDVSDLEQVDDGYDDGRYLVLMAGAPAVSYNGGVSGYAPTAPRGNASFDATSDATRAYTRLLEERQDDLAASVDAESFYHYTTALNGFAADLSGNQAAALARESGVIAVVEDEMREVDTWNTPNLLGLRGSAGLWRRLGGPDPSTGAGRGTIIGIVDGGIDSDSASFAPVGGPGAPARFSGICQGSDDDDPAAEFVCNDKLIGGRYYNEGYGDVIDAEFLSPEDYGGHGSHVGSTAAGNSGIDVTEAGVDFGQVSGMAPAAKVVSYKVCWQGEELSGGTCATSDSVAAIDDAVADGVDVINYSVSGTLDNPIDPVELAFMYAADAGVFVAASAGNSGPGASTVAHPSPWLTTVANSTHTVYEATAEFGTGESVVGASAISEDLPETPLVLAADIATGEVADARLCLPGSLDAAAAEGNVVVCERGVNARVEKSDTVAAAGGAGMILTNTPASANDLFTDLHAVPAIMTSSDDYDTVIAAAEAEDPTVAFLAGVNDGSTTPEPPVVSPGSSRGPSLAADGDLLKPDISAPGTDVLAAVAPEANGGLNYALYTGTSMSSPHIAGLALLMKQSRPNWSPMAMKSAMMTTAVNHTDGADPFAQGAGFVRPLGFLEPGLVFDSGYADWAAYVAGQGVTYADGRPFWPVSKAASDTNTPSIAINDLAGRETVTRRVTNVSAQPETYTVRKAGLAGVTLAPSARTFTIAPGRTRSISLTFERTSAPLDAYSTGFVVMKSDLHRVRVPVAISPSGFSGPSQVTVPEGGRQAITAVSGVTGSMRALVGGMARGVLAEGEADDTDSADFDPNDPRNFQLGFEVPAKTATMRIALEPDNPADDLDLYVFNLDTGALVAQSATGTAAEVVTVDSPPAGQYVAFVQAWSVAGDAASSTFGLRSYVVPKVDNGNLTVTPATRPVEVAESYRWTLAAEDRRATAPFLGVVRWRQGGSIVGSTLVQSPPAG